jgi:AcrR family transcriptional regulator
MKRLCIMNPAMSTRRARAHDRSAQKLRTRAALLYAARDLFSLCLSPSVAEVAYEAGVSRATAYRYFPTQEALLVEAPLDEKAPTVADLFGGDDAPDDPEDRAALVQGALYDLARDNEQQFRLFMRSSMSRGVRDGATSGDPFRGARRSALLREALAPLEGELAPEEVRNLATGLAMLVGVESMIVLRDVLRLDHDEARRAGEWAVRRLVQAARDPGARSAAD